MAPMTRPVHCVCCHLILIEEHEGPYLAICDDCVHHEGDCKTIAASESLEDAYESGDFIDTGVGTNPMRIS